MEDLAVAVILLVLALLLFVLSIRSFLEKGFLFNNAYLYASKKEREQMNKKPYYRQTAIVFFLMSLVFLFISLAILLDAFRLVYLAEGVIAVILIYAVVSSIAIEKRKKQQ